MVKDEDKKRASKPKGDKQKRKRRKYVDGCPVEMIRAERSIMAADKDVAILSAELSRAKKNREDAVGHLRALVREAETPNLWGESAGAETRRDAPKAAVTLTLGADVAAEKLDKMRAEAVGKKRSAKKAGGGDAEERAAAYRDRRNETRRAKRAKAKAAKG